MRRVSVVGNSGSGKSTVGRALAGALDVPYVELDAIFHQPGWQGLPRAEFVARVGEMAAGDGWVIDGNYSAVREPVVWTRADTVVWLDLPRRTVMHQIIRRSLRRSLRREELWNGNRESVRDLLAWDPERSMIRWAWTRHRLYEQRYGTARDDPRWAQIEFRRITNGRDADELVQTAHSDSASGQ